KTGEVHSIIGLPQPTRIGSTSLNDAETLLAFTQVNSEGVELCVADLQTFQARKLTDRYLNAAYGPTFRWVPGSSELLANLILQNRGAAPQASPVPTGPVVQENLGTPAPSRTYQYLLQNPHDEALFDYYLCSQLAYV